MQTTPTISQIVLKYLAWCKKNRAQRTVVWYAGHLSSFLQYLDEDRNMPISGLRPYHIIEWVDSKPHWSSTYKRGAIVAVQRACNFAEELGYIDFNPVKKVKKPPVNRRDNPMTPEDYAALLLHLPEGDRFRDLLVFVWTTGCRPQEARHIEPRHVQLEMERIVIPAAEAKGKRYPRVIYLQGPALEIVTRLMKKGKEGKVFRNSRGSAWTKYSICNRMERLSAKIGKPLAMYDARHGFGHRKLIQGHDHLTVAELMGHRDGSMLAKVYGHLDRNPTHLKKALED